MKMKNTLIIAFLLLLGMTTKAQFYIGTGENIHVVNGGLLYTNDNVSGAGSINVNLSTTEAKGSISGVTINAVNGTMKMSGSADQVVTGARYVDNAINRLFNHNTTSITIDGKVIVSDTLFMNTTGTPTIKMPNGDTLLLAAVVANGGEFQLNGGVLHLNPNALDYVCTANMIGDSGAFSTINITENRDVTFGTFDLVSIATIHLETVNNHIVRFANSSAIAWAGTQITINGWQGAYNGTSGTIGKIYFGTSATALTAAQLEKIRFYDGTYYYNATLLSTGELVPAANSITTGSVATTICPGAGATSIPFTYTNAASFGSSTTFTIQLSDASGSFATASTLGTVAGDATGSQSFSYNFTTSNITAGSGYRIRIISDAPAIDGSDNGSDITFQQVNTYYADVDGDTYGAVGSTVNDCSQPTGYVTDNTDCDDASATVYPGATETCNTIDDDCDGTVDDGVQTTYYADADNDTFGELSSTTTACSAPAGYVSNSTDCNDASATVYPGATETCNTVDDDCDGTIDNGVQTTYYADADNDTFGELASTTAACSAPAGYVSNSTDCNDASASVYPGATETCNTIDDNCDGTIDEGVQSTFYADADNDTFGELSSTTTACSAPTGYVSNSTDCNDASNTVYPGATETCNTVDDDCDGTTDEGVQTTFYDDTDNDNYGDLNITTLACTAPSGFVANSTDCDVNNGAVNPGAAEACNGVDDNCDGTTDEGVQSTFYADADNDTFGELSSTTTACSAPAGYVSNSTDCNDANNAVYPGATETCNTVDDDCDGSTDEGVQTTYYADADNDTYGSTSSSTQACSLPAGYVTNNTDCNDAVSTTYPGAMELCVNNADDDCDGQVNEGCLSSVPGDTPSDAIAVTPITQFGTGAQIQLSCNLLNATNSTQTGSSGNDMWYKFVAQKNAIRIGLKGSTTVADDNALLLYENPTDLSGLMIPVVSENDVTPSDMGTSTDAGNETILFDQLTPGTLYYLCVKNANSLPGTCQLALAYLSGSESDNQIFTNYTNTFNSSCQNFKVRFRSNAKYYNVHRLPSNDLSAAAQWIYAIPAGTGSVASTITQLGRIFPANVGSTTLTEYFKVDVYYELLDAHGDMSPLWANGNVVSNILLAPEAPVVVRAADACPAFKSVTSSVVTNRSVCGVSRYRWEWSMMSPTQNLPVVVDGSVGGIRSLALNQVAGMANAQRYDVRIAVKHFDNQTYTPYSSVSCVKTLGAAGMPTIEEEINVYERSENGITATIYPNPNNGQTVNFGITGFEGALNVKVTDARGRAVYNNQFSVEGALNTTLDFGQTLADGVYMVELLQNGELKTMRMVVSK
jgi:hypothetical protein